MGNIRTESVEKADNLKMLPNRADHNCFGCSPGNPSGLHLKFFTDGKTVFSNLEVPPHLCGWDSLVHGGVISTILDEIMGWTAIHLLKRFTLTRSITVQFLKPVHVGVPLRAEGRIVKLKNEREASTEGLLYREDELCARSNATFALFTEDAMRKMGILSEKSMKSVEHLIVG